MKKVGIIVQARTGSTRLPQKMTKPFGSKSLMEIILSKIPNKYTTILATTTEESDNALAEIAGQEGIKVFRGSESDVLERFIGAAEENNLGIIVRVCADNPFLNIELMEELIHAYNGEDYLSFAYKDGTPTILGHLGIFCEVTSLDTLKKVKAETDDPFYHEHVTNYIYKHPDEFKIQWLSLPEKLINIDGIRLTVDTAKDFELTESLYKEFGDVNTVAAASELVNYIHTNSVILSEMQHQIAENTK